MERTAPTAAILGIGTAVPDARLDQEETARRLAEALGDRSDAARWARRIFRQCGVQTRYTCEPNLLEAPSGCRYFPTAGRAGAPTTAERMRTYKRNAVPLALQAAGQALADSETDAADITHLITVSCTGQFLPGLDAALAAEMGLAPDVIRIPLNFLGCAAGLKAAALSRRIAAGAPAAKVLVVCVELCTLHIQPSAEREALFAASFFGDGASACVVGSAEPRARSSFRLVEDRSVLLPDSAGEMVWEIGDYGYELYLSPDIPKRIGRTVPAAAEPLLRGGKQPALWAVHPGGRGIVETLGDAFGLSAEQTRPSLDVLRRFGNMSSATILFVLSEMKRELEARGSGPDDGIALAFGPGLTVEMLTFAYRPAAAGPKRQPAASLRHA